MRRAMVWSLEKTASLPIGGSRKEMSTGTSSALKKLYDIMSCWSLWTSGCMTARRRKERVTRLGKTNSKRDWRKTIPLQTSCPTYCACNPWICAASGNPFQKSKKGRFKVQGCHSRETNKERLQKNIRKLWTELELFLKERKVTMTVYHILCCWILNLPLSQVRRLQLWYEEVRLELLHTHSSRNRWVSDYLDNTLLRSIWLCLGYVILKTDTQFTQYYQNQQNKLLVG